VTRDATVILESTTYPGTTEELLAPVLEAASGLKAGADFHVGYSPERIDPGNSKFGFVETPKVVSGISAESLKRVQCFYESIIDDVVTVSSCKTAEMTKLLENTFRHVNIALVNELAVFANQLGIDVWEAIDAASTKPFGYMRFTPGPGVGGHCLPVDPSYLSWDVRRRLGRSFRFVELANDINDHMPDYVVQRVITGLNRRRVAVNGCSILVLGLAYKSGTGDVRESPSVRVVELLQFLGADVSVADPHVELHQCPPEVTLVDDVTEAAGRADAVILLTDHEGFDYQAIAERATWVFDARNRMTGPRVERL
jgi:nucleotide sugar dehydrogenase